MADRPGTFMVGGARHYLIPETGVKAPGVTSILNMLPKPFLGPWQAKMTAEWAVANLASVADIASRDERAAIDLLKGAARRSTAGSADVGTSVHDYIEARLLGHTPGKLHVGALDFVGAIETFLDLWQPEALVTETSVWGEVEEGVYAGSFDAIVKMCGENVLVDWKSGRSAHEEAAIQLAAYRFSTGVIGGGVLPHIDAAAVVHVRPESEGGVRVIPTAATADKLEVLNACYRVFKWEGAKKAAFGKPMAAPPK